jgi:hypothetical protein
MRKRLTNTVHGNKRLHYEGISFHKCSVILNCRNKHSGDKVCQEALACPNLFGLQKTEGCMKTCAQCMVKKWKKQPTEFRLHTNACNATSSLSNYLLLGIYHQQKGAKPKNKINSVSRVRELTIQTA